MPIQHTFQGRVPIKCWTKDVDAASIEQLLNTATLPFVYKHIACMVDVHWGMGSTMILSRH